MSILNRILAEYEYHAMTGTNGAGAQSEFITIRLNAKDTLLLGEELKANDLPFNIKDNWIYVFGVKVILTKRGRRAK